MRQWEHFAHGADIGLRGFGANKAEAFERGALALTAASTPAMAGDDWSDTDHDLAALANSMAPAQSGATVTGFLRSSYANSGDFTTVIASPA